MTVALPEGARAAMLSIGSVAEATGVAVTALRYYEEVGIVSPIARVGGKRRFDPAVVGRVNFVRRAQEFGFSLEEIRLLLDGSASGWQPLVATKVRDLRAQRDRLDAMIALLDEVQYCGCDVITSCPRYDQC